MSKPATAATPHQILAKAGPYPLPAYQFVQEGLRFTVRRVHEQRAHDDGLGGGPTTEHVSGQQLCMGLRDYAIEQFGMLARVRTHVQLYRPVSYTHLTLPTILRV